MPHADDVTIRRARADDLEQLGRLGASLARAHHAWDPQRFFTVPRMHEGYAWWLGKELKNRRAIVLTAERRGRIVGYAYGTIEPRDWNALRDECGVGVDLIVVPTARGLGIGRRLLDATLDEFRKKGVTRVILLAAAKNKDAQRFFTKIGFRPTVVEMALELVPRAPPGKRNKRASR